MTWDPELAKARIILSRVAMRLKPFTSDDCRDVIDREGIQVKIQALGAAIAEAKVAGWITQVGEVASRRPENHRRAIDIYLLTNEATGKPVSSDTLPSSIESNVPADESSLPTLSVQEQLVTPVGDE